METKHTKGKWNLHLNAELTDGLSHWIATVKVGSGGIDINKDEAEANAKLISAAPDLLEFAIEMVRKYPNSPWIYEQGNKAIKKATE